MENKERYSSLNEETFYKYKNKRVIKTIDDIDEFINKYPRTNKELNTYIIKKEKGNDVSLLKSFIFYIFTQITSILAVCLVIFCIGFLIGNHISSKSSIINSINYNYYLSSDKGAELYVDNYEGSNMLTLDIMINFNFDYNNIFLGTLISNILLYYYPSNNIGLNSSDICYNSNYVNVDNNFNVDNNLFIKEYNKRKNEGMDSFSNYNINKELFNLFIKEESLIFLNYSIKTDNNIKITFINNTLYDHLIKYPIGGSDISISPGIMQGINSINVLISINHSIQDKHILQKLINDCKNQRIYIQLQFGNIQIKTILFRFQPQMGSFLPFYIPCKIKNKRKTDKNEFRLNVIKNYKVQKSAIKNINFFIN
ncbi:conserved Plasmodium protein, unknown function [Plasmodium reichenowi]|uniref:Uncharacterized protein n=1 Tax=Plasmodium reichenowi TaxID=5854 RepID=A0A060RUM0_PLARE